MEKTKAWLMELRLHQWTKNLLIAVPALASFRQMDFSTIWALIIGFISFGLIASASYIFNDIFDVENDRAHEIKKRRPLASLAISIANAMVVALLLLAIGLSMAWLVNPNFFAVICLYLVATISYSVWLKRVALVDCIVLAGLYTLRVIAGGFAIDIQISFWLLAFSIFFFLSIAWVKRYAELEAARSSGNSVAPGRGYAVTDMPLVLAFGSAAAFMAVLIFALYLDSAAIREQYSLPEVGWLAIPFLTYLIGRMWLKAHRGLMNEDPLLFILKDVPSLITIGLMGSALFAAHIGWPQ